MHVSALFAGAYKQIFTSYERFKFDKEPEIFNDMIMILVSSLILILYSFTFIHLQSLRW